MRHEDIKRHFLAWSEGGLDAETRVEVDRHLADCPGCREHFESLSALLESPDPSQLPRLKPDPYLPTRIRAIVEERRQEKTGATRFGPLTQQGLLGWIAASSLSVIVAMALGVVIGRGFVRSPSQETDVELVREYSEVFSPVSIFDDTEDISEPIDEEIL